MTTDGRDFLQKLAKFPPNTFEAKFLKNVKHLGLESSLPYADMRLLYRTAFRALLCNIAFNGLGGCDGRVRPERETHRLRLEREFMESRSKLLACEGWQRLSPTRKRQVREQFLTVLVAEQNFAWR